MITTINEFRKMNEEYDDMPLLELRTLDKVIRELGTRGNTKMPVVQFMYDNIERLTGKTIEQFDAAVNSEDGEIPSIIADMIGYYLLDGDDFVDDWNEIKNKNK